MDFLTFTPSSSWKRSTVGLPNEWSMELSDIDLETLSRSSDKVIENFQCSNVLEIPLEIIDTEITVLKTSSLYIKINEILRSKIINGQGFLFIKQIPVQSWGQQKSAVSFLLFSKLLGQLRLQNKLGHVLGHVADLGLRSDDPNVRLYQTCERQTFHTDSCDVVALLCLQPAMQGGLSSVVSAAAVFEEMRRSRPDLLQRLLVPMAHDRRGEVPPGQKPFYLIPVFSLYEGYLTVMYQRQYLDSAQRFPEAPQFSAADVEALDYFDALCNDPEFQLSVQLEPGDIQILHNHELLHDRSAFVNHPDPSHRRHLLRTWICPSEGRPLHPSFADRFGSVIPGDRGGVGAIEGIQPVAMWDIDQR